jgi:hypothetical protein
VVIHVTVGRVGIHIVLSEPKQSASIAGRRALNSDGPVGMVWDWGDTA